MAGPHSPALGPYVPLPFFRPQRRLSETSPREPRAPAVSSISSWSRNSQSVPLTCLIPLFKENHVFTLRCQSYNRTEVLPVLTLKVEQRGSNPFPWCLFIHVSRANGGGQRNHLSDLYLQQGRESGQGAQAPPSLTSPLPAPSPARLRGAPAPVLRRHPGAPPSVLFPARTRAQRVGTRTARMPVLPEGCQQRSQRK